MTLRGSRDEKKVYVIRPSKREGKKKMGIKLLLSKPRGFCAGVVRAIEIVEKALELYGSPIYVKHEIVHNRHVVDDLKQKGPFSSRT